MWSLGTLIWPPICAVLTIACVVLGVIAWRHFRDPSTFEPGIFRFLAVIAWVAAVGLIVGTAVGMYPYNAEYHQWNTTTGTVKTVSSRLLGGNSSITQRFVVQYTDGRQRSCDDTRCSLVKPGDQLTLSCKRRWQYAGRDGYDCNYLRVKP